MSYAKILFANDRMSSSKVSILFVTNVRPLVESSQKSRENVDARGLLSSIDCEKVMCLAMTAVSRVIFPKQQSRGTKRVMPAAQKTNVLILFGPFSGVPLHSCAHRCPEFWCPSVCSLCCWSGDRIDQLSGLQRF